MRRRDILAGLTGLALTLGVLWLAGLVWFAERVSHLAPQAGATDAIVVLTGGSERVAEGVALLAGGSARLLFVSGVPEGITGVFSSRTSTGYVIPRVFMDDTAADREAVQPPVRQIDMYPLSEFDGGMKERDWSRVPHFPAPAPQPDGGEAQNRAPNPPSPVGR